MNSFQISPIPYIHFGKGKLLLLPDILAGFGKQIMLLAGQFTRKTGWFPVLLNRLTETGITFRLTELSGEPSPEMVNALTGQARKHPPAAIAAIGGGSVIDAGKAVSAMIPADGKVEEYMEGIGSRKHPGQKIPFIAVPTTAGTGSEASKNAVLSSTGPEGFKRSLRHDRFVPDIAIIDPALTLDCPLHVSMPVGMDAFTQLLEAFTSTQASDLTDILALDGIKKAIKALPEIFSDPGNLNARAGMSYAAVLSGMVLANAGLGVVHGFASVIGGYFPIPHGIICGALLAPATQINIKKLTLSGESPRLLAHYAAAGRLFGPEKKSDVYCLEQLITRLQEWTILFGIPKLGKFGMSGKDIPRIISGTSLKNNPVKLEEEDLVRILEAAV